MCRKEPYSVPKKMDPSSKIVASTMTPGAKKLVKKDGAEIAAVELGQRLSLAEDKLGQYHPETLTCVNDLGSVNFLLQEFAEAGRQFERVVDGRAEALGADHKETLLALLNLGFAKLTPGDMPGAAACFWRVWDARKRTLGKRHPDAEEAEGYLKVSLEAHVMIADLEVSRSGDDPYENFIPNDSMVEDLRDIRKDLAELGEIIDSSHGGDVMAKLSVAATLIESGSFAEAGKQFAEAFAMTLYEEGPDSPESWMYLSSHGSTCAMRGLFERARQLVEPALAGLEATIGPSEPITAGTSSTLAQILQELKDYRGAVPLYRRALPVLIEDLGHDHKLILEERGSLAKCLVKTGDLEGAAEQYRMALKGWNSRAPKGPKAARTKKKLKAVLDRIASGGPSGRGH
jgi:tetratricopeptide (TPR) repeat protein